MADAVYKVTIYVAEVSPYLGSGVPSLPLSVVARAAEATLGIYAERAADHWGKTLFDLTRNKEDGLPPFVTVIVGKVERANGLEGA